MSEGQTPLRLNNRGLVHVNVWLTPAQKTALHSLALQADRGLEATASEVLLTGLVCFEPGRRLDYAIPADMMSLLRAECLPPSPPEH